MNRAKTEMLKLFRKNYAVEQDREGSGCSSFVVTIRGPASTSFSGGRFRIRIYLPLEFPFKSPSIGFITKVFHPNIDETSGSVCLDVLNQVWSPLYDVLNIIETFLPQLLAYPNPEDPLNLEAGKLFLSDREAYEEKVREYTRKYAAPNGLVDEERGDGEDGLYEDIA